MFKRTPSAPDTVLGLQNRFDLNKKNEYDQDVMLIVNTKKLWCLSKWSRITGEGVNMYKAFN